MSDQRQVPAGRLTAAGRASYELEARALAMRLGLEPATDGVPHASREVSRLAIDLARLVLRLTAHRDGTTVPEGR